MIRTSLLALALASSATAAAAQAADPHAGHAMPAQPPAPTDPHAGHAMPAAPKPSADPHAGHAMPEPPKASSPSQPTQGAASAAPVDPHAGHAMPAQPAAPADPHAGHTTPGPADPHAGHTMAPMEGGQTAAALPVGNAPAPAVITDNVADQVFGTGPMQRARGILAREHGGVRIAKLMLNLAEYQSQPPGGGYRWDVEGWYGGDINRFVFKSEGEGSGGEGVELAEVQALYSRAVARYTDVQVGVRRDFGSGNSRTYATVGVESLFPYWFEVEAAAFLSDRGDLTGRVEGTYDLRLTQRVILQPQAELRLSAQKLPRLNTGSGITHAELGLRLRYEIRREFAPYIGVAYERAFGGTADFLQFAGEDVESTTFVVGLRAWF